MIGRLDSEYVLRSSEAPLLTRKPGDYIRECYFTTQPLEMLPPEQLAMVFELIDAERTLLYASDYPHQDFDLPTVIHDLPFLSAEAKLRILGRNALELFGLDPVPPGRVGAS
jgi:predicted TIM-barrel fold metal-dependent hydrolase